MTPKEQYQILINYCEVKLQQRDWHGVSDAANDIRELIAKHPECEKKELDNSI
jgi:hypothetical protein